MAVPYERIVEEDLNRWYGTVDVSMPGGGSQTGTKVGIHTFTGWLNVKDFGAVGDGTTDDSAAIAAALAVASGGETLLFPDGEYRISETLYPSSFTRIIGRRAETLSEGVVGGSTLKWTGGANGTMVWLEGTYGTNIAGLNLNGNKVSGVTGYRIDSDNSPTSQRNVIRDFSAWYFGDPEDDTPGVAVHLGNCLATSPYTQYQSDGILLENFSIADCYTGVYFNSQNVDYTTLRNFAISYVKNSLHIDRSGFVVFDCGAGGLVSGAFIYINGPHGAISIRSCQAEQGTGDWLTVTDSVSTFTPITIQSCTVDLPITVTGNRRIISIGNVFNADVTLGDSVQVVSMYDYFSGSYSFVCSGSNSQVTRWNPDVNGHPTIDSTISGPAFEVKALTGNLTNPSFAMTNGAQQWQLVFPGAAGILPSGFVVRDNTAETNPFKIEATAPSDAVVVDATGRLDLSLGVAIVGTALTPMASGASGIWVKSGQGLVAASAGKNILVMGNLSAQVGRNSALSLLNGGIHTFVVHNADDDGVTRQVIQASATAQSTARLLEIRDASGNVRTYANPNGRLGLSLVEYADNTAALAGGLVAGDVYHTAGVVKVVT